VSKQSRTSPPSVGIVGASGYSGVIAARLLASHPRFSLAFCTSDRWVGDSVRARTSAHTDLHFIANAAALDHPVDAVLLATSAEVSLDLAPRFLDQGVRVVDLSGAFRLRDAALYPRWYRLDHARPALLASSHYGLPELFGDPPADARLVANPGCYATAAILAIAPLVHDGLVDVEQPIIVDGKSGVTGAGRQAKENYSFTEIADDVKAYRILGHQHTPEMTQAIATHAGKPVRLTFGAHLVPVRRGLMCTVYARPAANVTQPQIDASLRAAYAGKPFVEVVAPDEATFASVVGTNTCRVGAAVDDQGVIMAVGVLDNLVKGAAGQAVQNLDRLFGFADEGPEGGLDRLTRSAP
jgi:N-acetyl-gamma-glutamyl-phosphate reductase